MKALLRRFVIPSILAGAIVIIFIVQLSGGNLFSDVPLVVFVDKASSRNPADRSGVQGSTSEEDEEEEVPSCSVINPSNHGFIDLRELSSQTVEGIVKPRPWSARGFDTKFNYTLGICATPFKSPHVIQDNVNDTRVGAYYRDDNQKYVSIGEYATVPKFRGRKLTLTYENGSNCSIKDAKGQWLKKSTLVTFVCDREMQAKALVSFVGSFHDCNYLFEVRSHHACPTATQSNDFAVIWIFLLIVVAALMVYLSGGFLYKHMRVKPV